MRPQPTLSTRRLVVAAMLACTAPFLGACDWLRGTSEPEQVRILIESSDVTEVTLTSSFFFTLVQDPDCPQCEPDIQFIDFDTETVQLPFERTYAFTPRLQVFFEALPDEVSTLAMQVFIDDEVWYDDFRTVDPNALPLPESLRFVYQFADISF